MGAVLTLCGKDLRLLFRDRFALFWIFAFPLMYCLFFGALFGGGDGQRARIAVALVDEDGGAAAAELVGRLAAHPALVVDREGEGASARPRRHDLAAAVAAVRRGGARGKVAYVRIPAGYAASPFALFGGGGGPGGRPRLEVGIDPSREAEAGFLQGVLMEALFGGMAERLKDRDAMRAEIERSLQQLEEADGLPQGTRSGLAIFLRALGEFVGRTDFADLPGGGFEPAGLVDVVDVTREQGARPRSAFDVTFPSAMIWGLMGVAVGFAITLVRERTQGTLLRLRTAPLTATHLLAGKALACFATCMVVMTFLLVFGCGIMGVQLGSLPLLLVAMACTALCFTGLMMTAAVMGRTEQAVAGASWGIMMPFAMVGGGMVPLFAMPDWLLAVSDFSPFKWGIYALEGAIWRGFGPGDMVLPAVILLGLGAGFFAVGVLVFRRQLGQSA